jgi:hypothetical protein
MVDYHLPFISQLVKPQSLKAAFKSFQYTKVRCNIPEVLDKAKTPF